MNVSVLSCFDDNRRAIGEMAAENIRHWCNLHGYSFGLWTDKLFPDPYFAKLRLIAAELSNPSRNLVVWLDSYCFVFDKSRSVLGLLHPTLPASISTDRNGVCAGLMTFRVCDWARQLIDTWLFLGSHDKSHATDQDTLKTMMQFHSVRNEFGLISQDVVSNQEHIPENPFIHHYWSTNKDQTALVEHVKADLASGRPSNFHKGKL